MIIFSVIMNGSSAMVLEWIFLGNTTSPCVTFCRVIAIESARRNISGISIRRYIGVSRRTQKMCEGTVGWPGPAELELSASTMKAQASRHWITRRVARDGGLLTHAESSNDLSSHWVE